MEIFNLFGEQDWDDENDREGFRHRAPAIGKRLGAELLGGSLYELPPGRTPRPSIRSPAKALCSRTTPERARRPTTLEHLRPRREPELVDPGKRNVATLLAYVA